MDIKKIIIAVIITFVLLAGGVIFIVIDKNRDSSGVSNKPIENIDSSVPSNSFNEGTQDLEASACGNSVCEEDENADSCLADCHPVPMTGSVFREGDKATIKMETLEPVSLKIKYSIDGNVDSEQEVILDEVSSSHEFILENLKKGELYNVCYVAKDTNGKEFEKICDEFVH